MIFKILNRMKRLCDISAYLAYKELLSGARYSDPRRLARHELRVHSQNGEDGIIQHILSKVPTPDRTFIEIGVGNGTENNTRYLLRTGWTGAWIEADRSHCRQIRKKLAQELNASHLKLVEAFVSPANVDGLISSLSLGNVDLLSVDIDRDTHHVWERITSIRPAIAIIEYNASFPPPIDWRCEYVEGKVWDGSVDFGASLNALVAIAESKGYLLVGCDACGVNAFFVRCDLVDDQKFLGPFDAITHYEPPRYFLRPEGIG